MIQANELRLNNLIYNSEEKALRIVNIGHDMLFAVDDNQAKLSSNHCDFPPETANGIPLTEGRLLKFGFDDKRCIAINLDSSSKYLQVTSQNDVLIYDENDDFISLKPIQYVHQLQNLYFALTGTELEIK